MRPLVSIVWKKHGFIETGNLPVTYNNTDYIEVKFSLEPLPDYPDLRDASKAEAIRFELPVA